MRRDKCNSPKSALQSHKGAEEPWSFICSHNREGDTSLVAVRIYFLKGIFLHRLQNLQPVLIHVSILSASRRAKRCIRGYQAFPLSPAAHRQTDDGNVPEKSITSEEKERKTHLVPKLLLVPGAASCSAWLGVPFSGCETTGGRRPAHL